jgi:nucleotide-binding universal stress UspA family protein
MGLDVDLVLVPIDGSDGSEAAAGYAAAVAARYDAALHAVYVLDVDAVAAVETGRSDESTVAAEAAAALDAVLERAVDAGVETRTSTAYGFSRRHKSRHPGSVVLDTADQVAADFLVVPRSRPAEDGGTGTGTGALERVATYVLHYASQPVLSV